MRSWIALPSLLVLAACATTPPEQVVLGPGSPEALVVMEVVPAPPGAKASYRIEAAAFDPAQKRIANTGYFYLPVDNAGRAGPPRYAVAKAKPGLYALTAISHQGVWYNCFNDGTYSFEVKPGTVTYLGRLDPRISLMQIAARLPSYSTNGTQHHLLDVGRPALIPPSTAGWEADFAAYVKSTYPLVNAPIAAAELKPATFASGWSLFGQKVCYGWFNRAKKAPKPAS